MRPWITIAIVMLVALSAWGAVNTAPAPADVTAQGPKAQLLNRVRFDQRLNERIPLETTFFDEAGREVRLDEYFGEKAVVLVLGYFRCPNLCLLTRQGLVRSLVAIDFSVGKEFEVVYISIDPTDTPAVASANRDTTIKEYDRPGTEAGWHFLTATEDAPIRAVADAVGFRYLYDETTRQYAHPSGIVVLTPEGRISRYLFGIQFAQTDMRLALMEASNDRIGSLTDAVLLRCYHYDPKTGKYSVAIFNLLRVAGTITVLLIGGLVWFYLRRESSDGTDS